MKKNFSSLTLFMIVAIIVSCCYQFPSIFAQTTETKILPTNFEERPSLTPSITATLIPYPTHTQTQLPPATSTPDPTATLPRPRDWQIGYTVIVIDDPINPENHHWEIRTVQLNNPIPEKIIEDPGDFSEPKWSPNGKWVAYFSFHNNKPYPKNSLNILEIETGRSHEIENVDLFDWSADSQAIIYVAFGEPFVLYNEFTYYRVSVDDLSQPSVFFTAPWLASRLAWSPKGDRILAVGYAQVGEDLADHAYLIDLEGHFQQIPLEMVPRNVSWHPSGEKFVYDYYEKDIYKPTEIRIFDLNTQEEQELTDEGKVASSPGFSPNGKHLVYISTPTGLALTTRNCIYILHVETKETTRLGRCYQSLSYPVWSPDGKYLAFLWLSEPPNWPFPGSLALSIYEFETDRYIILAEKGLEGMPPVWIPR